MDILSINPQLTGECIKGSSIPLANNKSFYFPDCEIHGLNGGTEDCCEGAVRFINFGCCDAPLAPDKNE